MNVLIDFLTGKLPFTMELTILGQALGAAMAVKRGRNWDGEMHWFHAFVVTCVTAFAGGLFNFMWMGKPTSMISNDVVFACCVISYATMNFIPLNLGFKIADVLPVKIAIVSYGTLFKSLGMVGFTSAAYHAFEDTPSKYYPTPIFGPIWYGVMLGQMGGFVTKGIDGYLSGGIPWPFQNGLFCAPFFHLYAHDKTGFAGGWLRTAMSPVHGLFPDMDDKKFAVMLVSLFMQVITILQMPAFLGPSFNPFTMIGDLIIAPFAGSSSKSTSAAASLAKKAVAEREIEASENDKSKKKKNKRRTAGKSKRS